MTESVPGACGGPMDVGMNAFKPMGLETEGVGPALGRSNTPLGFEICVYMRVYARICVYMRVYACICVYMRVYACICVSMRVYGCICVYMRVYACILSGILC